MDVLSQMVFWDGALMLGAIVTVLGIILKILGFRVRSEGAPAEIVLQAAIDGVVTLDERGRIAGFNPAAERLFGYGRAQVIGCNLGMLMPEPYCSQYESPPGDPPGGGAVQMPGTRREVVGRRSDGTTFAMEVALGEGWRRGRRLFAAVVRDISDREQGEAQLKASESKARAILETAVDGIVTIDRSGIILSANPATVRLFGYQTDELTGRNVSMLMPEPHAGKHDGYLRHYLQTGERHIIGIGREVFGRRKDGSTFPMELSVGEAVVGGCPIFTGIVRDISDRKRAEAELSAARDQAERAILSQSKFLAAASHDLRQPIQALTLFTSALGSKLKGTPASALLDDMKGSVEAMTMLLDALLDVSRLDAGVVVPHETTFSLASVLERLAAEFRPQAEQKELDLRVQPCSAVVRTDPILLYRILQNFISNSLRYTSQGKVLFGCRRLGRKLRISVLDTGIGIPGHLQQEIFKEFFQIGNPERDRSKGLGLGLAIVQRLSRLLHAPVLVRATEGRGSAFSIDIPLVGFNRIANVFPLRPPLAQFTPTGKGLIYVIDDEPSVLKGLRLVLEDWGYTVLTGRTELEAVSTLTRRQQAPDLIIADYRLRSICNGGQVVAQIREMFNRQIPGILITGDTAPERIREATASGLRLMHKPIEAAELRAAVLDSLSVATGEARNTGV
jgi:PAS domain S-box-containing protein